jgi:hypothetical protein
MVDGIFPLGISSGKMGKSHPQEIMEDSVKITAPVFPHESKFFPPGENHRAQGISIAFLKSSYDNAVAESLVGRFCYPVPGSPRPTFSATSDAEAEITDPAR